MRRHTGRASRVAGAFWPCCGVVRAFRAGRSRATGSCGRPKASNGRLVREGADR